MKIKASLLKFLCLWSLCLAQTNLQLFAADTNAEPVQVTYVEATDLRDQLDAIQRSNNEATEKWDALVKQNLSLSNRLAGLSQSLTTQRERELELGKQSYAFNLKVICGAAAAILLVFLLSYWFQLRCFSRVMEISRSMPQVQHGPALLENDNTPASKLLGAMKLLEHRIHQLEVPSGASTSNGYSGENHTIHTGTPSIFAPDPTEGAGAASNVSLLLAKGQILLDTERLAEAVGCFSEALTLDPANAEAHLKKGIALERMNRLEQSLDSYEEALRLNPKRAVAYVYKARVLAGLHRYDEALSVYDSALGKNAARTGSATLVS